MRRRTLLAAVGCSLAGTAGCAGLPRLGGDGGDDDHTPDGSDDTTRPDGGGDAGPADTPVPADPRWGDDAPCQAFDDRTDAAVCAGAVTVVDHVGDDAVLDPRPVVLSLDADDAVETLALELRSHDGEALAFNPNAWSVHRYADGAWTRVAEGPPFQPLRVLPAGETFTWSLATEQHPTPADEGVVPAVADLRPGRYAFSVPVSVGEEWDADRLVACNALFSVRRA